MGKVAFVFSGQGDQHPGMGKELKERHPVAAQIFSQCDKLRPQTSAQCFYGSEDELKETRNTQPCLFATEMAMAAVLLDQGVCPDAAAGFSLGELPAATISGMLSLETGFRLVCKRGDLMQRVSDEVDTAMAAVLRLSPEQIQELCEQFPDIYPVNYNCPGQITVSGLSSQFSGFTEAVREKGGRALPLKVKTAFHSPFMKEAAKAFASELANADLRTQRIPLYSNLTAEPYTQDIIRLLSEQICNPVQWERLVCNMISDGVDTFIEIGPGRTLTNMIRKIDPAVKVQTVTEVLEEKQLC